jgi:hypothetical protein
MVSRRGHLLAFSFLACLAGCNSSPSEGGDAGGTGPSIHADASVSTDDARTDATPASDSAEPTDGKALDAGPYCATPLTADAGPASLDDLPLATWCEEVHNGSVLEFVYPSGLVVVSYAGAGIDCSSNYAFDGRSRQLVAAVLECNGCAACLAGDPAFQCPTHVKCAGGTPAIDCVGAGFTTFVDLCVEAGLPPLADGAGHGCTSDSGCPTGYQCAFPATSAHLVANGCANGGVCLDSVDFRVRFPNCVSTTTCACDGTLTHGCVDPQGDGYFSKPVPSSIPSGCPDGM